MIEDVFLERLIIEVCKTYDEWYASPGEVFHKHREAYCHKLDDLKSSHIQKLVAHYNKERFTTCENLYEERVKFLTEVQQIVDISREV